MKETNPTSEHLTSAVEEGKIPAYRHTETLVLAVQQLNSFPVSKEVMQKKHGSTKLEDIASGEVDRPVSPRHPTRVL